jgi:adenosine deaminase
MRTGSAYCRAIALLLFFFFSLFSPAYAQTSTAPSAREGTREQRAARAFAKSRGNPLELHAFLVRMPKGGDLHNHLDGAVYAESRIRAAAEDHLCVALAGLSFVKT